MKFVKNAVMIVGPSLQTFYQNNINCFQENNLQASIIINVINTSTIAKVIDDFKWCLSTLI